MAFLPAFASHSTTLLRPRPQTRPARKCPPRMETPVQPEDPTPPLPPKKLPVTNSPSTNRKLVRNTPSTSGASSYAQGSAGDMVGGPSVGEGLGPRRGVGEKRVTKAAAIQKSQSFADAWAEQNQGRPDVWLLIGALFIITPFAILAWAVATGVIPTGGLFE